MSVYADAQVLGQSCFFSPRIISKQLCQCGSVRDEDSENKTQYHLIIIKCPHNYRKLYFFRIATGLSNTFNKCLLPKTLLKELKKTHEFMERPIICQNEKIIVLFPSPPGTQSSSRTLWGIVHGGNGEKALAPRLQ